jgi:hypothetical protein
MLWESVCSAFILYHQDIFASVAGCWAGVSPSTSSPPVRGPRLAPEGLQAQHRQRNRTGESSALAQQQTHAHLQVHGGCCVLCKALSACLWCGPLQRCSSLSCAQRWLACCSRPSVKCPTCTRSEIHRHRAYPAHSALHPWHERCTLRFCELCMCILSLWRPNDTCIGVISLVSEPSCQTCCRVDCHERKNCNRMTGRHQRPCRRHTTSMSPCA